MRDGGLFGIYAGSRPETAAEVCDLVARECRTLAENVTTVQVERARAQLKAQILMARESTGQRAEQAATQMLAFGRLKPVEEVVAAIDAIDVTRVANLAAQVFDGSPTFAAAGAIQTLPPADELRARFAA